MRASFTDFLAAARMVGELKLDSDGGEEDSPCSEVSKPSTF
jgi:hypothetical protein